MATLTMVSTLPFTLLSYLFSLLNVFFTFYSLQSTLFYLSKETYHKRSWDNRILHCSRWPTFPSCYTQGSRAHRDSDYKLSHKGRKKENKHLLNYAFISWVEQWQAVFTVRYPKTLNYRHMKNTAEQQKLPWGRIQKCSWGKIQKCSSFTTLSVEATLN